MKIYLASPFFNTEEQIVYEEAIRILRHQGLNVFVPREHTIPNGWDMPNHVWGESVFSVDYLALAHCDVVVVLNFGMYSDSGTAWESGCAYALGKDVVNILCGCDGTEYSLMMVNGTTATVSFDEFRYNSLEECICFDKNTNEKILQK